MGHPIHKHMHTHITKSNVKAAIKDDKAHMDYLKRDIKDDQKAGGKYKDINQTADEKHISKLAGDVKYDEKKEGMSRYEYEGMSRMHSPLNVDPSAKMKGKKDYSFGQKALGTVKNIGNYAAAGASKFLNAGSGYGKGGGSQPMDKGGIAASYKDNADRARGFQQGHLDAAKKRRDEGSAFFRHTSEHSTEEYMARKDAAIKKSKGMSRYSSPVNNITYGDKSGKTGYIGQERYDLNEYNPVDDRAGSPAKFDKMSRKQEKRLGREFRTAMGTATKKDKRKNKRDTKKTMRHVRKHGSGLKMD